MKSADVIVVGSGPAGVSAAWPLLEAGLRVLMIDASSDALPPSPIHTTIDAFRRNPDRSRTAIGLAPTRDDLSPKFTTPLAQAALAGFADSLRLSSNGYVPVGSLAAGGLSRIWGALAVPYTGLDLADFPDRTALATSFQRVAARIGLDPVASPDDARLSEPALRLLMRHRSAPADRSVRLAPAPNAVLSKALGERSNCISCGLCLYGCARGAIYDSASELPALSRQRAFTYRPRTQVIGLRPSPLLGHAVDVISDEQRDVLRARYVVLAAGTIATTAIAARVLGQQGRRIRLLGNPVAGMALLVPGLIGVDLPERSFGLGQLTFSSKTQASDDVTARGEMFGVLYGADTLPLSPIADRMPFTRPTSLRLARALAPALLLASGYLSGEFSDNHMIVDGDHAAGGVTIEGVQTPEAETHLRAAFADLARFARRRGAWTVPRSMTILPPGSDAHPVGTLPMQGPGVLATEANGQLRGCSGIFVADGACLPHLAAKHPTLTIMANADRIGSHVAAIARDEQIHARAN